MKVVPARLPRQMVFDLVFGIAMPIASVVTLEVIEASPEGTEGPLSFPLLWTGPMLISMLFLGVSLGGPRGSIARSLVFGVLWAGAVHSAATGVIVLPFAFTFAVVKLPTAAVSLIAAQAKALPRPVNLDATLVPKADASL